MIPATAPPDNRAHPDTAIAITLILYANTRLYFPPAKPHQAPFFEGLSSAAGGH